MLKLLLFCGLIVIASAYYDYDTSDYFYSNEESLVRNGLALLQRYENASRPYEMYIDNWDDRNIARARGKAKKHKCIPGEQKRVGCNRCHCIEPDIWACTLIKCKAPKGRVTRARCSKPGTWVPLVEPDCANCFCVVKDRAICLRELCEAKPLLNKPAPKRYPLGPKNCVPGSGMLEGRCSICRCNRHKQWDCNQVPGCSEALNRGTCETGKGFYNVNAESCTNCHCVSNIWQCIETPAPCKEQKELHLSELRCPDYVKYIKPANACGVCVCDAKKRPTCIGNLNCDTNRITKLNKKCDTTQCMNHCDRRGQIGYCSAQNICKCD